MSNTYDTDHDTEVVGIIPARGESKGIERKNIRLLNGLPLIAYSIRAALRSHSVDSVVVSTEDREIAHISKQHGARVPFMRPVELAADETPTEPVLTHLLKSLQKNGEEYETLVLLQPTSPLRTAIHIDEAYELYASSGTDSVISAYPTRDIRWKRTPRGAQRVNYVDGSNRRQDREPEYIVNGAIYTTGVEAFLRTGDLKNGRTELYEMSRVDSADIDTPYDLWYANKLLTEWKDHD
mgnify:CR=1 FL=1